MALDGSLVQLRAPILPPQQLPSDHTPSQQHTRALPLRAPSITPLIPPLPRPTHPASLPLSMRSSFGQLAP
eukprot:1036962-Rhodomonas_salina.1